MRASHITPFIESVQLVFETMLNTKVTVDKPYVKTDETFSHDITGIIALSGEADGAVAVTFPQETAVNAVEAFSGSRLDIDDDNFSDAIGELANMIAGNAKKSLDNLHVNISIPTVVIGRNHRLGRHQLGPWVLLECHSPLGSFNIEVCIVEVPVAAGAGGKR